MQLKLNNFSDAKKKIEPGTNMGGRQCYLGKQKYVQVVSVY